MVTAGALSYSVYLWHAAIIPIVDPRPAMWLGTLFAMTTTLAVAGVVYYTIERPAITLGRVLSRCLAVPPVSAHALDQSTPVTAGRAR